MPSIIMEQEKVQDHPRLAEVQIKTVVSTKVEKDDEDEIQIVGFHIRIPPKETPPLDLLSVKNIEDEKPILQNISRDDNCDPLSFTLSHKSEIKSNNLNPKPRYIRKKLKSKKPNKPNKQLVKLENDKFTDTDKQETETLKEFETDKKSKVQEIDALLLLPTNELERIERENEPPDLQIIEQEMQALFFEATEEPDIHEIEPLLPTKQLETLQELETDKKSELDDAIILPTQVEKEPVEMQEMLDALLLPTNEQVIINTVPDYPEKDKEKPAIEAETSTMRIIVTIYKCNICLRFDFNSEKEFMDHFVQVHHISDWTKKCRIKSCKPNEEFDFEQNDVDRYEQFISKPVPGRVHLLPNYNMGDFSDESEWEDLSEWYCLDDTSKLIKSVPVRVASPTCINISSDDDTVTDADTESVIVSDDESEYSGETDDANDGSSDDSDFTLDRPRRRRARTYRKPNNNNNSNKTDHAPNKDSQQQEQQTKKSA